MSCGDCSWASLQRHSRKGSLSKVVVATLAAWRVMGDDVSSTKASNGVRGNELHDNLSVGGGEAVQDRSEAEGTVT